MPGGLEEEQRDSVAGCSGEVEANRGGLITWDFYSK
jgi:hypothetical protein